MCTGFAPVRTANPAGGRDALGDSLREALGGWRCDSDVIDAAPVA
jgi:hypothetical protein